MPIHVDSWLKRAEADYYMMFVRAWIPFNAWFMDAYFQANGTRPSDRQAISKDLLRTRKKDSYVICRIFEEDMMLAEWQEGMKPYYDSLANYCLIRRNEYKTLPTSLEQRMSALLPYLDGAEWETNSSPMEFLKARNAALVDFIKREWLNTNM